VVSTPTTTEDLADPSGLVFGTPTCARCEFGSQPLLKTATTLNDW
jgi:hypothetical protein